jgi:hypothetical protein
LSDQRSRDDPFGITVLVWVDKASRLGAVEEDTHEHVAEGIRSLHERLDDLERLVVSHGGASAVGTGPPPAWRRPTEGEARWQVALATAVAIALQVAVPGRLTLMQPSWVLPLVQGVLLVGLVSANPHRINRESRLLRLLSLTLATLLSLGNAWSVARLVEILVHGGAGADKPGPLLITAGSIWLTNVVVFALWYWEFDRGGPVARAQGVDPYPDFQFVQMVSPREMVPPHWEPAFADYLYLAFTNATAFSPTDVMPLSRWAKMAMTLQAAISILTVTLVVARAVNILQ